MGVFDFADAHSAISLAQFVLRLRTHFQDIKGAISIEAVDSLSPLRWRSDLPDFETQFGGQSDERVVSWIHEVHVQTSSRYGFLYLMPSPNHNGLSVRRHPHLPLVLHPCSWTLHLYHTIPWLLTFL